MPITEVRFPRRFLDNWLTLQSNQMFDSARRFPAQDLPPPLLSKKRVRKRKNLNPDRNISSDAHRVISAIYSLDLSLAVWQNLFVSLAKSRYMMLKVLGKV